MDSLSPGRIYGTTSLDTGTNWRRLVPPPLFPTLWLAGNPRYPGCNPRSGLETLKSCAALRELELENNHLIPTDEDNVYFEGQCQVYLI